MSEHFCCFHNSFLDTKLQPSNLNITAAHIEVTLCITITDQLVPYNYWKLTFIVIICIFFLLYKPSAESGQDLFSMQIITVKKFLLENIDT